MKYPPIHPFIHSRSGLHIEGIKTLAETQFNDPIEIYDQDRDYIALE